MVTRHWLPVLHSHLLKWFPSAQSSQRLVLRVRHQNPDTPVGHQLLVFVPRSDLRAEDASSYCGAVLGTHFLLT